MPQGNIDAQARLEKARAAGCKMCGNLESAERRPKALKRQLEEAGVALEKLASNKAAQPKTDLRAWTTVPEKSLNAEAIILNTLSTTVR